MPKTKSFKFSSTQSTWLEDHLAAYVDLQDGLITGTTSEDDILVFLGDLFDALEEKFSILKAGGTKEAVVEVNFHVLINYNVVIILTVTVKVLRTWMRLKAKREGKKRAVVKTVKTTAKKLFHQENFATVIRPEVVKELGEHNSNNPLWVGMTKKKSALAWAALSLVKKQQYEKRAQEINKGELAREEKAAYVISPYRTKPYDEPTCY